MDCVSIVKSTTQFFFIYVRSVLKNGLRTDDSLGKMAKDLRIILIGKHDSEKKETGDTILKTKETNQSFLLPTKTCQLLFSEGDEDVVHVLNTPNFFDDSFTEIELEIGTCIHMSAPGPHAIILVVPFGKLDEQYVEDVELFIEIFGKKLFEHLIVVLTCSEYDIETKGKRITRETINKYVSNQNKKVKQFLVEKCQGRVLGINNKLDSENLKEQVAELISLVPGINSDKPPFFTNIHYENAEKVIHDATKHLNLFDETTEESEDTKEEAVMENQEDDNTAELTSRTTVKKSTAHTPPNQPKQKGSKNESSVQNSYTNLNTDITSDALRRQIQQNRNDMRNQQIQMANLSVSCGALAMQILSFVKRFPK